VPLTATDGHASAWRPAAAIASAPARFSAWSLEALRAHAA
jgi:hypothetical protein